VTTPRLPRLPIPVLVCLPSVAVAAAVTAVPAAPVELAWLGALLTYAVGLAIARQLRGVGRTDASPRRGGWAAAVLPREVARVHLRASAALSRAELLEGMVETSRSSADSASATTARLLSELVAAEESTRAHLAAELHDTVAQSLSEALVLLQDDRRQRASPGVEALVLAEEQLRAAMARMRPAELARGELAVAIQDLCAELEFRYGVPVTVTWSDEQVALSLVLATTVYRFAQEMLLNAAVHADGIDVRLSLDVYGQGADGRCLEVTVTDAGPGFDPGAVVSTGGRHVGLRLAADRAALAGGRLDVETALGAGTCVRLVLPLPADAG
jgi:signal transduction histidine kinase